MITDLRCLWKQAFGDPDPFLDTFFSTAYSPERCRCLRVDGRLAAALYWFDCQWADQKLAYLYAVATEERFRGQGLCRRLMEDTHRHLQALGYAGAVLVPGNPGLFQLYEKLGYRTFSYVREFTCPAGAPVRLRPLDVAQYASLRREFLPDGGVIQEGEALRLLAAQASFFEGDNCVFAATVDGDTATVHELLGDPAAAPGITAALGAVRGRFRTPGTEKPFAMYHGLSAAEPPAYFGLALD